MHARARLPVVLAAATSTRRKMLGAQRDILFRFNYPQERSVPLAKELLDILVCPQCKGDLQETPAGDALDCNRCRLRFAIRDGIPVMLVAEATKLD